tara:strand:- start:542 stop:1042 length:501 start_codon:yes stop_codon:yes gene_type:complete
MLNNSILKYLIFFLIFFSSHKIFAQENETVIEIDQPRFSEKGVGQKAYEIKAKKGLRSDDNLRLYEVEGKFKTDNGLWIYMNAEEGNYDQSKKIINLFGDVKFYTEEGDKISSHSAKFIIEEDLIIFQKEVFHERINSSIKSDKIIASNNFNNIFYEGNVLTNIIR